jgi:5-methyltetrahydropteroyltriglutamate--homocysteine methyltransferase
MANREFAEIELIAEFAKKMDVAVGVIDVKSYYIETSEYVASRINKCLEYISVDKLSVAPDCGLSQTARWATKKKLVNMVAGAKMVRDKL